LGQSRGYLSLSEELALPHTAPGEIEDSYGFESGGSTGTDLPRMRVSTHCSLARRGLQEP